MTNLDYKAKNIAAAEKAYKENFLKAISSIGDVPSISTLLFLYEAGGATEEDFEKDIKDGIDKVTLAILSGVNEAGFLGKKIDMSELEKEMESAKTSLNTGETAKK